MRRHRVTSVALSVLFVSMLMGQQDVSLRNRIVPDYTVDGVRMLCGTSFTLGNTTHYAIGTSEGVMFYSYSGGVPTRVGRVSLLSSFTDMDDAPIDSGSRLLALVQYPYIMLWRYDGATISPYGRAGLGQAATRVQVESLGGDKYLVIVGLSDGRVRCYGLSLSDLPASSLYNGLNLGSPAFEGSFFARAPVTALRAWTYAGQVYVAIGGGDGMLYLCRWDSSQLRLVEIGKGRYHPSPISEIVVNGSRLAVACWTGHVYVWNWSGSGLTFARAIKYVASRLEPYSLCALPNDRIAVATGHVKVYSLQNGLVLGMYGSGDRLPVGFTSENVYAKIFPSLPLDSPFPIGSNTTVRFVQGGSPFYREYRHPRPHPVNDLAEGSQGRWIAVFGDGYIVPEISSPIPLGSPAFAVLTLRDQQDWVLVSYGDGRVYARSLATGMIIANILPPPSFPRVISVLRLLSQTGNRIWFVLGTYGGELEVWEWTLGSSIATLVSAKSFNAPITDISVSPDKSNLLVSSRVLIRVPVDGSGILGSPSTLVSEPYRRVFKAQYNPDDPRRCLVSLDNSLRLYTLSTDPSWQMVYESNSYTILPIGYCAWLPDGTEAVSANPFASYVGVYNPQVDSLWPDRALNPSRGLVGRMEDRSLIEVYNPEQGYISSLLAMSDGSLVAGTRSGRVVKWARGGRLVARSYPFGTNRVSFAPQSGFLVLTDRIIMPNDKHAILSVNPYFYNSSLALPGGNDLARVKTSDWYTRVISSTSSVEMNTPRGLALDVSEDGTWIVSLVPSGGRYYFSLSKEPFNNNSTFTIDPQAPFRSIDLSPQGSRLAVAVPGNPIRVYHWGSNNRWDQADFNQSTVIADSDSNAVEELRFLADDVLLVVSSSNLAVYQLQGGAWVLRSPLPLPPGYQFSGGRDNRMVDSVQAGGIIRVALKANNGLIFYKLTRPGNIATLTEVGRSSLAANGFLDVGDFRWIYFSRYPGHNGNYLALASGVSGRNSSVIVFNLQGLFNW